MLGSLIENTKGSEKSGIPLLVDLAFASNIRFLDEHELHLNDPELYKVSVQILLHYTQLITRINDKSLKLILKHLIDCPSLFVDTTLRSWDGSSTRHLRFVNVHDLFQRLSITINPVMGNWWGND